jgi:hypothetical protein
MTTQPPNAFQQMFIVTHEHGTCGFYTDLGSAETKMRHLFQTIHTFKYDGYKINVYNLHETEYILTNTYYLYHWKDDTFQLYLR